MTKFKRTNICSNTRLKLFFETRMKRKELTVAQGHANPERKASLEEAIATLQRTQRILTDQWTKPIDAVLEPLNGRASAHTLTGSSIVDTMIWVEGRLARDGVPLAQRKGVRVEIIGGVPTTKSYARKAHTAATNRVVLERTGTNWWMTECERIDRWAGPGGDEKVRIFLTDEAKQAVIKHALREYE